MFASAPMLWLVHMSSYEFIGAGDFISPFNLNSNLYNQLFTYNNIIYDGIDVSFLIAQFSPFLLLFAFLNLFSLSPLVSTLLFLSLILFLSEISMFFYLRYILIEKFNYNKSSINILCMFGGILYAFSPYMIPIISPGHILQLFIFAYAPIMLLLADKIFSEKRYDIKKFIYLFLLSLCCATTFANIGMMYVLFVLLGLYYFALSAVERKLIQNFPKLLLLFASIILSNIWWLMPFFVNLNTTIQLNQSSDLITDALGSAVNNATLLNLFMGRGENLLYEKISPSYNYYYTNTFMLLIFIIFNLFMFYAIFTIKKNRFLLSLLIVALGALFIAKGSNQPFDSIFMFLYEHFPGFQIFRRPVSKFYWVFLLTFIPIFIVGISLFLQKTKNYWAKLSVYFFLIISVIYLFFSFVLTPVLTPFNIPKYYYEARDYLQIQSVNRIFIIPGFFGTYPRYDESFNNFYGSDFITALWNFPQLVPDSTPYSPNLPYKESANSLMQSIRTNESYCDMTKKLGITHIMVRYDIDLQGVMQDNPNTLIKILDKSPEVISKRFFSSQKDKGIIIYTLKKQCAEQNSIVYSPTNDKFSFSYSAINPVMYKVRITNVNDGDTLTLLNNFSPGWKIFADDSNPPDGKNNYYQPHNYYLDFQQVYLITKESYNDGNHFKAQDFANGWKLSKDDLAKIGALHKNQDGTVSADIILFYTTQLYLYIGIIVFLLVLVSLLFVAIYSFFKHKKNE